VSRITLGLPRTTLTMDEGRIVRWLKRPGEAVAAGEAVVEVETDKSVVEVEAPQAGYLRRILAEDDAVVPVGAPIALLTDTAEEPLEGESPEGAGAGEEVHVKEAEPGEGVVTSLRQEVAAPEPEAKPRGGMPATERELRASPAVRRAARRQGVDLRRVPGSGPGGRILLADLEAFLRRPAPPEGRPSMRRAIARAMVESWREKPQFSVTVHVDMSRAETFRQVIGPSFEASRGVRLSVMDLLVQAVARTLPAHPLLNCRVSAEGEAVPIEHVDIGLAVAVEDGLLVPVLRAAERKSLAEIAVERKDLTTRAMTGKLRAQDLGEATFTISNLGPFGVDQFQAIVIPGEPAILAVGRLMEVPRVVDHELAVRPVLTLTLAVDHRVADGAAAARFLADVKDRLERDEGWILF
jgi:pyruvate dehydrogenase E2 component (dihydrolipoamide acetyltransferase)